MKQIKINSIQRVRRLHKYVLTKLDKLKFI